MSIRMITLVQQVCQIAEGEIAKEAARNASLQLLIHLIRGVTFFK